MALCARIMEPVYHPILENPFLYEIDFFSYKFVESNNLESYIELHLRKEEELIKLKFWAPQDLEIEKGFPLATGGMYFEDISNRGLENLNIYVGDFESSCGSITFFAKKVELV